MSMPTSAIAVTAEGFTSSPGMLPAERTSTCPPLRWVRKPAAIWDRPALCTQTNRTLGMSAMGVSAFRRRERRVVRTGAGSRRSGLCRGPGCRRPRRHPGPRHNPDRRDPAPVLTTRRSLLRKALTPMADMPSVLFVCVHNAGRSQMAAGFLTHLSGGQVEVRSAGSIPGDEVNPSAVTAMAEVGIDISSQTPKVLTTDAVQASDVVITMGCGDACPIFPGKRYLDWDLEDPAGQGLEAVRPIRDEIKARIQALLYELLPTTATNPVSAR